MTYNYLIIKYILILKTNDSKVNPKNIDTNWISKRRNIVEIDQNHGDNIVEGFDSTLQKDKPPY